MKESHHKTILQKSEFAYSLQKMIQDEKGKATDAIFLETNDAFAALTGLYPEEIIGKSLSELSLTENASGFDWQAIFHSLTKRGNNKAFEYYHKPNRRWYKVHCFHPEKGLFATFLVDISKEIKDLQKMKRLEKLLLQASIKAEDNDMLRTAFLANISHEIRTPMNGILGFLELIKQPDLGSNQKKKYIDIINKSSRRLMGTINDIVEMSLIESGQLTLYYSDVDLAGLMRNLCKYFRKEVPGKEVKLILTEFIKGKKAYIHTDKHKLNAILSHLLSNALKFTSKGIVEFGNTLDDGKLMFYVKDTGTGIPRDKVDMIFDRFVQADMRFNRPYEGSGLGLPIARAYAEAMDGEIWLETRHKRGSTFFFTIPYQLSEKRTRDVVIKKKKIR